MLIQPDHVSAEDIADALAALDKKGKATAAHRIMRTELLDEGQAVQCLYIGPYDSMGGAISTMRAFAESHGLELAGKHHDVYLSDPHRTGEAKDRAASPCALTQPSCCPSGHLLGAVI